MSSPGEFYSVELAAPRHLQDVLRIMRENFYHEETMFKSLCSSVALEDEEKKKIDEFFDGSIKAAFENSPCLVAIRRDTGRVVGANVMATSLNPKTGSAKDGLATIFASETPTPLLAKTYVDYLTTMNERANLFDAYPDAKTVWEFYAVAIDKDHRKLGLARSLLTAGINLAKKSRVSLVFGVFTSIYSRKSAEKAGMKSFMEFDLDEYRDRNGGPVFRDTHPHNVVSVMVLKL